MRAGPIFFFRAPFPPPLLRSDEPGPQRGQAPPQGFPAAAPQGSPLPMSSLHDRILRGTLAGFALFALAGSMTAVSAAPEAPAPAVAAEVQAEPALPRFKPAEIAASPAIPSSEDAVRAQVQAATDDILRDIGGGLASWYGTELAGHRTASGEPFDPADYTAAHRSLPFGSKVRVTSLTSGRSVIVRINDRGPFSRARVIDVSKAAARDLGLVASGSGQVRLQLVAG